MESAKNGLSKNGMSKKWNEQRMERAENGISRK